MDATSFRERGDKLGRQFAPSRSYLRSNSAEKDSKDFQMDVALNRSFDSPFPDSATVITIINHDRAYTYIYTGVYPSIFGTIS